MAPSPFLPETKIQFAWDSTSLGWFKTCPRKYQYHMIEGWRKKTASIDLRFGQHYHSALEQYYKLVHKGSSHEDALRAVVYQALLDTWDEDHPWTTDHPNKNRETLIRSIVWYLEHFREDTAKTVIIQTEEGDRPAVELSFQFHPGWTVQGFDQEEKVVKAEYVICGHIDRLVEFAGDYYSMDHKTTKSDLYNDYFKNYKPDNQMSLYTIATQVIYNTKIKAIMIDAAQIMVGFTRFQRGFSYRTPHELEEWLVETKFWLDQAANCARKEYWPMNDKSCFRCEFREVCSQDPALRKKFLETKFERIPWNPLEAR